MIAKINSNLMVKERTKKKPRFLKISNYNKFQILKKLILINQIILKMIIQTDWLLNL